MKRLTLALAAILAGCGKTDAPAPSVPPAPAAAQEPKQAGSEPAKTQESSPETLAQTLMDEAARKEIASGGRPDVVLAAYHEVCVRYPFTAAGKKALARCVELEADAVTAIDKEFEGVRSAADTLAKNRKFFDAIASLEKYSASTPKESLKRRAKALIERIENDARKAYVDAVRAARKSAHVDAERLIKEASEHSTPEVNNAAERDLSLLEHLKKVEATKRAMVAEEAALKAFGDRAAKLLKRLKERAYAEVIKELDAAIADPSLEPCRDSLTADRAAAAAAATFWEAIQKTLKARLNQEITLKTADGKSVRGVLKKIHESGLSVRLDPSTSDTPLDSLHSDQLVSLAIHSEGLAENAGASYAAAAMWFFLEGRQAESRLELATAQEMEADITLVEASWRRGFFRMAQAK
ncbi:MAG TPA: hypothetical protein VFS19_02085 [Planctomycetota bacterium]|nr:hypothetical protein [Planctomycetota bacterium]